MQITYAAALTIVVGTIATAAALAETFLNCLDSILNIIIRAADLRSAVSLLKKKMLFGSIPRNGDCLNLQRRPLLRWRCARCTRSAIVGW